MKYLFYTENYEPGGGNRYMIDFINTIPSEQKILLCNKGALFSHNINALDNTVKIFESKKILFLLHPCYIINLFFRCVFKIFKRDFKYRVYSYLRRRYFKNIIDIIKPDCVIAFNGGMPGGVSVYDILNVSVGKKIPALMSVVCMHVNLEADAILYNKHILKQIYFICNANCIANTLQSFSDKKVFILYNKIEKCITSVPEQQDYPAFGYIGRIEESKGIFTLMEAFGLLPDVGIRLYLFGKLLINAQEIINFNAIHKNQIVYKGPFHHLDEPMHKIDIFIFVSYQEGLPFSLLEALAYAKPIIATSVGGIPEIIQNGFNGFLVTPKDSYGLAQKMHLLYKDKGLRAAFSNNAHTYYTDKLESDIFSKNVIQIINTVVGRDK